MKVSHDDHDYLKLLKYPLEKYYVFFSTDFVLNVAIYTFTMRSTFTFFTFQKRNNINIRHFINITFMVYIIIKTQRKGDSKHLITGPHSAVRNVPSTDPSLTEDSGVESSISAQSHTFM